MKSQSVQKFVEWLDRVTMDIASVHCDDRKLWAVAAEEKWGRIPPHVKFTYQDYKLHGVVPQFIVEYILSITLQEKHHVPSQIGSVHHLR
jgi:hypothetical protein